MPIIVNAEGHVAGRLSSWAAKQALQGNEVIIVNSEKAVILGSKRDIISDFQAKYARGERYRGPFYPRMPDRILRRIIRGMLPYKKAKGKMAFRRVRTYISVPPDIDLSKCMTVEDARMRSTPRGHVTLGDISRRLGARWSDTYPAPSPPRRRASREKRGGGSGPSRKKGSSGGGRNVGGGESG